MQIQSRTRMMKTNTRRSDNPLIYLGRDFIDASYLLYAFQFAVSLCKQFMAR